MQRVAGFSFVLFWCCFLGGGGQLRKCLIGIPTNQFILRNSDNTSNLLESFSNRYHLSRCIPYTSVTLPNQPAIKYICFRRRRFQKKRLETVGSCLNDSCKQSIVCLSYTCIFTFHLKG